MKNNKQPVLKVLTVTRDYTRIKSPVFASLGGECLQFLDAAFRQDAVCSVEINTVAKSALMRHDGPLNRSTLSLGGGRNKRAEGFVCPTGEVLPRKVKFNRIGSVITLWEPRHCLPGRLRLHNPLLYRRSAFCKQVEKDLSNWPAVLEYKANNLTGNIAVAFDPAKTDAEGIVRFLDKSLAEMLTGDTALDGKKLGQFEFSSAAFASALLFPEAVLLNSLSVLYTGYPIFKKAAVAIKDRKVKVDILDTVVVGGCLAAGQISVAAFMVWVVALADKIQDKTSKSTGEMLSHIFGNQPRFAWVEKGGKEVQAPVSSVKKGGVIIVHSGEAVPLDGEVCGGSALVDQSALTGESQPVEKRKGEKAFACTTVISGEIRVSVEKTGQDTIAGKIQQIITEAAEHKTKAHSVGELIADKAVIPTLMLGGVGLATGGPGTALAVVNSDFGTGIRVAAPTLLLCHLIAMAKRGILVKRGEAFDKIANVEVFMFDKTGTLTEEVPRITETLSLEAKYTPEQIIGWAAAAERHVSHPIARAIVEKAAALKLPMPQKEKAKFHIGLGVEVTVGKKNIKAGSARYLAEEGVKVPRKAAERIAAFAKNGQGVILVAVNNRLAGIIGLKTVPRKDAFETIKYLRSRGVKEIVLISGDHEDVTRTIAAELGVDKYYAGVLPHEKADYVKKYKAQGKIVAMVGDGVNDGPALSTADVSISLKGASSIAVDTADIIFMDGHFEKIHVLFDNAYEFKRGITASFRLIAIPNAICIIGALLRFWGLGASLIFNNFFNILATVKATAPLYRLEPPSEHKRLAHGV